MQTIQVNQLKSIMDKQATAYVLPSTYEVTIHYGQLSFRLIQIIVEPRIELLDSNSNHYTVTWNEKIDVTIYKRTEYYFGE